MKTVFADAGYWIAILNPADGSFLTKFVRCQSLKGYLQ